MNIQRLWKHAQDCPRASQTKPSGGAHKVPPLAEELLAADSCLERESLSSLRVWLCNIKQAKVLQYQPCIFSTRMGSLWQTVVCCFCFISFCSAIPVSSNTAYLLAIGSRVTLEATRGAAGSAQSLLHAMAKFIGKKQMPFCFILTQPLVGVHRVLYSIQMLCFLTVPISGAKLVLGFIFHSRHGRRDILRI